MKIGNKAELHELREQESTYTKVERELPVSQVPFFTNPSLCSGGQQVATLYIDSWQNPGKFNPNGTPDPQRPELAHLRIGLAAGAGL